MTREHAQGLRTARDTDAKLLSRKPKYELVAIYQSEGGFGGGTWSKGDLISSILSKRFPLARQNEAIHVLWHEGSAGRNTACGLCQCQETWTAPSGMVPGSVQLMQCVLDPGHRGFCCDELGLERRS
jgi:hypothetical protein